MMYVMRVLDECEPKETTELVTFAKCIRQVLQEFPDVMPEELPELVRSILSEAQGHMTDALQDQVAWNQQLSASSWFKYGDTAPSNSLTAIA